MIKMAMSKYVPNLHLSNGFSMPIVGLGTWLADKEEELTTALDTALELGYRHFDTAYIYGNEAPIGKTLKKWIDSGKIRRNELFIVTKLPNCGMKKEKVAHFFEKSLSSLQLDYVDLYLVHAPFGLDSKSDEDPVPIKNGEVVIDPGTDLEAIWKAMESLVQNGKVKSIGISNFDETQIQRIVKAAKIPPTVLQIEISVYFQQTKLRSVCAKNGIQVCAYSPLGSPGRKEFYNKVGLEFQSIGLLQDPVVIKIAQKLGKSEAQICLRFLAQQGIAVIPKSTSGQRLKENFNISDFELDSKDMLELEGLDKGYLGRTLDFNFLPGIQKHPEFPKDMKTLSNQNWVIDEFFGRIKD